MSPVRPQSDAKLVPSPRDNALKFLLGRIDYERTSVIPYSQRHMKLDRMRQLLNRLGNPDSGMPIVHVAGTKGKGSTSALVASILGAAGYETGLFSSPHVENMEERFSVGGLPCTPEDLVTLVQRLMPVVEAMDVEATQANDASLSPTYFELTTALALLHFAQRQVDIAVLEVGLGGRLDATNVCQPLVTAITSISFDHTRQLGNTLAEIAAEKAGIIKPGVPVFCGPLGDSARSTIAAIAAQHGSRMYEIGRDFIYEYSPPRGSEAEEFLGQLHVSGEIVGERFTKDDLPLGLIGEHQAANAALAVAINAELRRQGWSISDESIRQGLAELTLPARIEVMSRRPDVVLDVAHNVASAEALIDALQTSFLSQERILVFAASRDKDVAGIVRTLLPHFQEIVLTEFQENPRAVPVEQLQGIIEEELSENHQKDKLILSTIPQPVEAWRRAYSSSRPDQLICITGSFFIAAELRGVLRAEFCEAND